MTVDYFCEQCPEGFEPEGPHWHEILVQREGASTRTADDLAITFLDDAGDILRCSAHVAAAARYWAAAIRDGDMGCHWLPADETGSDLADALQDDVLRAESALAEAGYLVNWDDGYTIGIVH